MDVNDFKSQLNNRGAISFVPSGNSMWPFLKNGKQSVIVVNKTERLNVYDVAMYYRDNGDAVLHRVVGVTNAGYVMQGDSHRTTEPIKEEQVFGVMQGFFKGKTLIESTDKKYKRKVKKYYERKKLRIFRIIFFQLRCRIKNRLKKIFCK